MFGGSKGFGQPAATPAFSAFNTPQQNTAFGQASAFAKPAGAFGSTFGQQNNSVFGAQPTPGTSLFGATNSPQQTGFGGKF
jgi:hypothetical protein